MKSLFFWLLLFVCCVVFFPVIAFFGAIFPALCPAEWNKAKNGGF